MILGQNVIKGRARYSSAEEARAIVTASENDFEGRLDIIADKVASNRALKIVALSGPSCSGKTTTANKLISELEGRGRNVHVVSIDDFFYDREKLDELAEETGKLDYDSIRAIDFDAFVECVEEIFKDGKTRVPRFDFKEGRRVGYVEYSALDEDIFIFEGIQAIYPVFTNMINGIPCVSLIINVEDSLTVGNVTLPPRTVRLMRRLVRDYRFRGADPVFSFRLWEGVTANEDKNILPFTDNADFHINSLLGYEACMLKPYLEPLLHTVPADSLYRKQADELLAALDGIDTVSADYLPENALYKEFI